MRAPIRTPDAAARATHTPMDAEKERAWQQDQNVSSSLPLVRRKPRPRCGLRSQRVFQPRIAKVKAVEPASDATATIDRLAGFSRKNVTSRSRLALSRPRPLMWRTPSAARSVQNASLPHCRRAQAADEPPISSLALICRQVARLRSGLAAAPLPRALLSARSRKSVSRPRCC